VDVNTQPPQVTADGVQHYINQGGAELVTFTVSGYWTEAGVRVGPYTFRSFPLPGRSGERFSIFAFPWDVPADTVPIVYASNPSGAEAKAHFWLKVFPKKFRARDLELTDAFIGKVTDEIDPNGTGDKLQRFLKINGDLRRQNNQTLADLRLKTEERMLWSGPFWRYGKTESEFADHRAYVYHGKVVDHQTHLGFDLSDVQHAPVVAANDGRVVFAAQLGIYGNCIVVDHGYARVRAMRKLPRKPDEGYVDTPANDPRARCCRGNSTGRGSALKTRQRNLLCPFPRQRIPHPPLHCQTQTWAHNRVRVRERQESGTHPGGSNCGAR